MSHRSNGLDKLWMDLFILLLGWLVRPKPKRTGQRPSFYDTL